MTCSRGAGGVPLERGHAGAAAADGQRAARPQGVWRLCSGARGPREEGHGLGAPAGGTHLTLLYSKQMHCAHVPNPAAVWAWSTRLLACVHSDNRPPPVQVFQKTPTPYSIETRKGFPHRVADLRRVRVSAASTVFIMQPDSTTVVTPNSHGHGRSATPTELNALKTATALHVSAMTGPRMNQTLVIQDSAASSKEIGYMEKFQKCAAHACMRLSSVTREYQTMGCNTCVLHQQSNNCCAAAQTESVECECACRGVALEDGSQVQEFRCALQPLGEEVMTSLTAQCACRPGAHHMRSITLVNKVAANSVGGRDKRTNAAPPLCTTRPGRRAAHTWLATTCGGRQIRWDA
jgi:hypothetical protein